MKIKCEREGCEETFIKKTHNQKYCTDECCRLATNERIMQKYYARREQRQGVARYCEECETTKLSRYNDGSICNGCKSKRTTSANDAVVQMLSSTNWALSND